MSCYNEGMPMQRELNHDFFKKWSPEMAYVLGYFAADGSMLKNSRGGYYIEFTSIDRILLEHLRRATCSGHRISQRPIRNERSKQQYRIQVGSREWFNDLTRLGFTQNKSHTLQFPKVPQDFIGDFIRGYFDGDGCVYFQKLKFADRKRKRLILQTLFTSGSIRFLTSLHRVLKRHGVRGGSLKKKKRGFELMFSYGDSLALYNFMYHTAQILGLDLPRKRKKLEKAIESLRFRMRA